MAEQQNKGRYIWKRQTERVEKVARAQCVYK